MVAGDHELRDVLAGNVRRVRKNLGLTQDALGDAAGLDRTFIGAVERSETNISIDNIAKLARALGVEAYELMRARPSS
jgi:transcriptional regulator with XRE-family HTH domain